MADYGFKQHTMMNCAAVALTLLATSLQATVYSIGEHVPKDDYYSQEFTTATYGLHIAQLARMTKTLHNLASLLSITFWPNLYHCTTAADLRELQCVQM